MESVLSDLREDVLNSIDSVYAEHSSPSQSVLVESIKGVFLSADEYDYPELKRQIVDSVEFQFAEGDNPRQAVIEKNIEAVFLSWRHKRSN